MINLLSTPAATIAGGIAIVTFQTCGCHQVDGVAIVAGGASVVDAVPIAAARVRTVIHGWGPGNCCVTLIASCSGKQSGMECRIGMTGCTGAGKTRENPAFMATCAGQPGMSAGQREFTVVETGR